MKFLLLVQNISSCPNRFVTDILRI